MDWITDAMGKRIVVEKVFPRFCQDAQGIIPHPLSSTAKF